MNYLNKKIDEFVLEILLLGFSCVNIWGKKNPYI